MTTRTDVLDELEWRGLIADSTDRDALREEMAAGPITFYVGIDPTAPSMHMGHLVQLLTARRLQEAGHLPLILVGGATGLIGDPKESTERVLNPKETVAEWTDRLRDQVGQILSFEGEYGGRIVNNYDWTEGLSAIDFLRDIGKHFPVNRMLDREAVRARLEGGISYTEFSYVLLQAMDYLELYRRHGCRLQTGGSDQWGNITAGVELIRRADGARVHALATPLVTKADGTKFGKTESGTIWLDPEMTSPYAYYQFWFNTDDRDVITLLKYFSFRSRDEIGELEAEVEQRPRARAAQRALARELTTLTHGAEETSRVEAAAGALFGSSGLDDLDDRTLGSALREANLVTIHGADGLPSVVDLFVQTGLAASRSAARRTVNEGGAYLNNERVTDPEAVPAKDDLLHGRWLVLRKGKRTMAGVEVA